MVARRGRRRIRAPHCSERRGLSPDGDVYAVGMAGVILGLTGAASGVLRLWCPGNVEQGSGHRIPCSRDELSGVKEIDYSTDGGASWTKAPADPDPEVTISAQGTTVLECRAVDEAGNVAPILSETFHIDNTPPTPSPWPPVKIAPQDGGP